MVILLFLQQQIFDDALLNADDPRSQGVHHEVQRLVFDVGEGRSGKIRHEMRRHTEDTADFRHRELLCFQKLAVLRRKRDGLVGHSFFEHRHTMGVGCATVCCFPVIPDTIRVLDDPGVFEDTAGLCAILEERRAVLIHRNGSAEAVLHHGDRRKADQTIETQSRHMEDLVPTKVDILVLLSRNFVRVCVIDIIEFSAFIPVHLDIFR